MRCTLKDCLDEAVLHYVGIHPRSGRSTTGVGRCYTHRNVPMSSNDFSALAIFFDPVVLGSVTVPALDEEGAG